MKTEELITLGLTKEQADQVFALHGKEINAEKGKYDALKLQYDTQGTQLTEANKKLEGYDPNWKTTVADAQRQAQEKLDAYLFDAAVKSALTAAKAKDPDLVMVKLNKDGMKLNNGEVVGLKEQLEKVQKDLPYLFETEETKPHFVQSTPGAAGPGGDDKKAQANAALRAAFGKGD